MNKYIYEYKYNKYKKSNLDNKNYKINKYLNKLNIYGGASKSPTDFILKKIFTQENLLGEGGFGQVYKFMYNGVEYVCKKFTKLDENEDEYLKEKKLYIKKLSIKWYKNSLTQYSKIGDYLQITDVETIKQIDGFENLIMLKIKLNIPINEEVDIIGVFNDTRERSIGTYHDGEIYIDTFKSMRLVYYNDEDRLLFYKYLGIDLSKAFSEINDGLISLNMRVILCMDLIRQVDDLIKLGIYHNDIKLDNIVIIKKGELYYLTLVDYGSSFLQQDIDEILKSDLKQKIENLYNLYSLSKFTDTFFEEIEKANLDINININKLTNLYITYTPICISPEYIIIVNILEIPNLYEQMTNLYKIQTKLYQLKLVLEQLKLILEQPKPELDQLKPKLDQLKLELDQLKLILEQQKPKLYQLKPKLDQLKLILEQPNPELNQLKLELDQLKPKLNQLKLELDEQMNKVNKKITILVTQLYDIDIYKKMYHWSLAGICISILNWKNVYTATYLAKFTPTIFPPTIFPPTIFQIYKNVREETKCESYKTEMLGKFINLPNILSNELINLEFFKNKFGLMLSFKTTDKQDLKAIFDSMYSFKIYGRQYDAYLKTNVDKLY